MAKKETSWLEFTHKATGEAIRFPYGVVEGAQPGPTLVVMGGMHGSEFCGIEAAIRLLKETKPENLKGTLKVVTIYNLPAFEANLAFLVPQDGINPGRSFPGSEDGTYSEAMGHYISETLLRKADFYVELHGGDIPEALTPFVMYSVTGNEEVDAKARGLAEVYNIPIVVAGDVRNLPKPIHTAGFRAMSLEGLPGILTESGQQGILTDEDTERHLVGLRNVMKHLGMIEGEIVNTVKRMYSEEHIALRSEHEAMWYPFVKLGDWVKKDQVIGEFRDYFGEYVASLVAPVDAHVTVFRSSPHVDVGNVCIELDRVTRFEE